MTTPNYPAYPMFTGKHRSVTAYLEGFSRGLEQFEAKLQPTVHGDYGPLYYRHEGAVILNTNNSLLKQGIALAAIIRAHDPHVSPQTTDMDIRRADVQRLVRESNTVYQLDVNLRAALMPIYEQVVPQWQELFGEGRPLRLQCAYLFGQQFGLGEFEQPRS